MLMSKIRPKMTLCSHKVDKLKKKKKKIIGCVKAPLLGCLALFGYVRLDEKKVYRTGMGGYLS